MTTYVFQKIQQKEILDREKVIVKSIPVPATVKEETFSLKDKEDQIANLQIQKERIEEQIIKLEDEITEIKTALKI